MGCSSLWVEGCILQRGRDSTPGPSNVVLFQVCIGLMARISSTEAERELRWKLHVTVETLTVTHTYGLSIGWNILILGSTKMPCYYLEPLGFECPYTPGAWGPQ